jgi:hypothetical protein
MKKNKKERNMSLMTYLCTLNRRVEQLVARWAHNPKVTGSSPVSASDKPSKQLGGFFCYVKDVKF